MSEWDTNRKDGLLSKRNECIYIYIYAKLLLPFLPDDIVLIKILNRMMTIGIRLEWEIRLKID